MRGASVGVISPVRRGSISSVGWLGSGDRRRRRAGRSARSERQHRVSGRPAARRDCERQTSEEGHHQRRGTASVHRRRIPRSPTAAIVSRACTRPPATWPRAGERSPSTTKTRRHMRRVSVKGFHPACARGIPRELGRRNPAETNGETREPSQNGDDAPFRGPSSPSFVLASGALEEP